MDPLYESILNKIWLPMQQWKARNPRPTAKELKEEIYEFYHGENLAAPAASTTNAAYDACVGQLAAKVTQMNGVYFPDTSDHVFMSPNQQSSNQEWRVYVNIQAKDLCEAGNFIIDVLFKRPFVTGFKAARSVGHADHFTDPLVIYCTDQDSCGSVKGMLSAKPGIVSVLSNKPVPEMTRRLADGIGMGESPRDFKVSFGAIRAAAIAKAVVAFWDANGDTRPFFNTIVEHSLVQIGLDPNNAFKNSDGQPKKIDVDAFLSNPLG